MTELQLVYPALYKSASDGADRSQKMFILMSLGEFLALFLVSAIISLFGVGRVSSIVISITLVILAAIFVFRSVKNLEEDWYRCRALAESVKTATWRFCMCAQPFEGTKSSIEPRAYFRNSLREILKANQSLAEHLSADQNDQVTDSMMRVRSMSLEGRVSFYVTYRIDDQRAWYSAKSAANRRSRVKLIVLISIMYILAFMSVNGINVGLGWLTVPFDPLVVAATSALGWLHLRRHGELLASYNLTAHEIGIIRSSSDLVTSEEDFSDFVNEAELAFSREHTQWVARRGSS